MNRRTNHVIRHSGAIAVLILVAGCPGILPIASPPRVSTGMVRVGDENSLTVSFTAEGVDPDGGTTRYLWDFKDGTIVSTQNPSHTFATPGFRQIDLTVTDDEGMETRVVLSLTVPLSGDNPILERSIPDEGQTHVAVGTNVNYVANPPASGSHYSAADIAPTAKGFRDETVRPEIWVHNLEHGDIVVLYDCPGDCPADFLNQLRSLPSAMPNSRFGTKKIVITRYPGLTPKIMAVAWGIQLDFESFDQDGLVSFYQRHVSKGPEDLP